MARHGVYYPWAEHFLFKENSPEWDFKHEGKGSFYKDSAKEHFPKLIDFIQKLPFSEIGRVSLFGMNPTDDLMIHRDKNPAGYNKVDEFITISPAGRKSLFIEGERGKKIPINSKIYWFNNLDFHGVAPDPWFKYSIRVDGVFNYEFAKWLQSRIGYSREASSSPLAPEMLGDS